MAAGQGGQAAAAAGQAVTIAAGQQGGDGRASGQGPEARAATLSPAGRKPAAGPTLAGHAAAPQRRRSRARAVVDLDPPALARLMPMHLLLTRQGRVRAAGPTLVRLFGAAPLIGRSFFTLFDIRAPAPMRDMVALVPHLGQKLQLQLRRAVQAVPGLRLRGLVVPLAGGDGYLVNLSFGIDIVPAVGLLQLNDADFAPTELALELLYLAEANAAVMAGMRALSQRLEAARLQAEEEAMTDPLTGLRNRRACDSFLARLCREDRPFALLHIDLDYFKQVNDRMGHAAGDRVLVAVAEVLQQGSATGDCVARVGGDEFVMILPGTAGPARLREIGARIIAGVAQPVPFQGQLAQVAASIGVVSVPGGTGVAPEAVLAQADQALYAAKEAGRGRMIAHADLPQAAGKVVYPGG